MTDSNDPMETVRRYVDAFNNGDEKAMVAACADPMQILDGMSPHVWQGPTAAADWWRDALAEGEHLGVSDYRIELGEPHHVDIADPTAYVVVPVTFGYNVRGEPVLQTGAVFTLALRKVDTDWLLTAWAWAKGQVQQPH
ncbi:nuclear transport factor 2 family protein [Nocardia sp. NPDC056611]|uniref:nuclear transport factor 2 family protein n=1 Tax=Nocardia sp. NPDC056611 TaxID=3345877 RepID=UPI00366AB7B0